MPSLATCICEKGSGCHGPVSRSTTTTKLTRGGNDPLHTVSKQKGPVFMTICGLVHGRSGDEERRGKTAGRWESLVRGYLSVTAKGKGPVAWSCEECNVVFLIFRYLLLSKLKSLAGMSTAINGNVFAKLQGHLQKQPERTEYVPKPWKTEKLSSTGSGPAAHVNFFKQCSCGLSVWLHEYTFTTF